MKTFLTSIIFVFCIGLSGKTQVFPLLPKYYQPLDSSVLGNKSEDEQEKKETLMKHHEKVSYSVVVGTGYSSFGNNLSMMNSYLAPTIDYEVNSKLNVSVTGIVMQNNYNGLEGFYGNESGYFYNSNTSNYGITGSAYYQLNEKWSVWGGGVYMENQSIFNDYRAEVYNTDYKSVSFGLGYKVNDKVQFNIQYRYSNGLDPSYSLTSPFYTGTYNPYRSTLGIWDY